MSSALMAVNLCLRHEAMRPTLQSWDTQREFLAEVATCQQCKGAPVLDAAATNIMTALRDGTLQDKEALHLAREILTVIISRRT